MQSIPLTRNLTRGWASQPTAHSHSLWLAPPPISTIGAELARPHPCMNSCTEPLVVEKEPEPKEYMVYDSIFTEVQKQIKLPYLVRPSG